MKVKVAQSVKGKLSIPYMQIICKAGVEIDMDEKIFNSKEIQSLLQLGLLETEEKIIANEYVEYKNNSQFKLVLPWGQTVRPKQNFQVEKANLANIDLVTFIKEGLVSKVIVPKNAKTNVMKSVNNKKGVVKNNKAKMQNSETKNNVDKQPKSISEVVKEQKVPQNMHIHKPIVKENEIVNLEEDTDNMGIKFVDQQQKKDKMTKLQKLLHEKTQSAIKK